MKKGTVKLTLKDAKKLYEQGGNFRTIALSAYPEEELTFTPKNGDFVFGNDDMLQMIFIFKDFVDSYKKSYYASITSLNKKVYYNNWWRINKNLRLATEEEKQQLLNALHKDHKDWDEKNKCITKYRWRAEKNENYYFMSSTGNIVFEIDRHWECDNDRYNAYNYAQTREELEPIAKQFRELLKNR